MVIDNADLVRIAIAPNEDHPPLVVDPNRMKRLEIAFQSFEAIGRRNEQIVQTPRGIDSLQSAFGAPGNRLKLAHNRVVKERLGALVAK